MPLNCNEIYSTAAYLQAQFESCRRLQASDLDLLVDLIIAVQNCSVGDSILSFGNIVVGGTVYWIENLDFGVTPISYLWEGQLYTTPPIDLTTLNSVTGNDRIDVFAVDVDTNTVVVIEGIPASSPQEPTINFSNQLRLCAVLIQDGATKPTNIDDELVYDENLGEPNEWEGDTSYSNIYLNYDADSSNGIYSILLRSPIYKQQFTFTKSSIIDKTTISSLNFKFKAPTEPRRFRFKITLYNGNDVAGTAFFIYNDSITYGYNPSITSYQTINIPIGDFISGNVNSFSKIVFEYYTNDNTSYCLFEEIKFIQGIENPQTGNYSWLGLNDTYEISYIGKAGYISTVRKEENGLELKSVSELGLIQDLQDVTDEGNVTTNDIIINGNTLTLGNATGTSNRFINFNNYAGIIGFDGNTNIFNVTRPFGAIGSTSPNLYVQNNSNFRSSTLYSDNLLFSRDSNNLTLQTPTLTGNHTQTFQDASGTIALLSDLSGYIPLSGTEVGSPVTGDVLFQTVDGTDTFDFNLSSKGILYRNIGLVTQPSTISLTRNDVGQTYLELEILNNSGLPLSTAKGIVGTQYYGANYDDNTYVQKKYVDDSISAISGVTLKYSETFGNGSDTTITITHSLGTSDLTNILVREVSSGEIVYPTIIIADTNTVELTFSTAPTTNQYRVTVTA